MNRSNAVAYNENLDGGGSVKLKMLSRSLKCLEIKTQKCFEMFSGPDFGDLDY